MPTQITDPGVLVNDVLWAIVPNSLVYTEGQGTQEMKAASVGGGKTEQVFSDNVEDAFGMVKFSVFATIENIKLTKATKSRKNNNVVQIFASNVDGRLARTFTQAAMLNDPEKALGADTTFEVEFTSNPAI